MASSGKSQNQTSRGVQVTVDLLGSAGRLSLEMGLKTARQVAGVVSASSTLAAGSVDVMANVAARHVKGLANVAFAVGTNLQSGLVDAAVDIAGIGPHGQRPVSAASGLSMSFGQSAARRLAGVRSVASGTLDRPVRQKELVQRLTKHQAEATAGRVDRTHAVTKLWNAEGLSTTIARHRLPDNALSDPALPPNVLPIAHVGFGAGSARFLTFDAARIEGAFTDVCAEGYREFSYEGIGAILRAYERGFFKLSCEVLGFLPFDTPDGPDPRAFFANYFRQFPPHIQRLIAHGYGRLLAFSTTNIYDTIAHATRLPHERIEPVVHGAAFAFAMINMTDLPHILRHSAVPFDPSVRAAFQNGLVYALVFLDWFAPGVLAHWRCEDALEAELINLARRECELAWQRGFPLAARLADPRG